VSGLGRQAWPRVIQGHHGQRSRGELLPELSDDLGDITDEVEGEVLEAGVVADQEDRSHVLVDGPQASEELLGRCSVETGLDLDLLLQAYRLGYGLQRLPGASR
jgi:hypothetical protein